jgi:hypothetical protein
MIGLTTVFGYFDIDSVLVLLLSKETLLQLFIIGTTFETPVPFVYAAWVCHRYYGYASCTIFNVSLKSLGTTPSH